MLCCEMHLDQKLFRKESMKHTDKIGKIKFYSSFFNCPCGHLNMKNQSEKVYGQLFYQDLKYYRRTQEILKEL